MTVRVRLAEHHVIGAGLSADHRVMAGDQGTGAGDIVWLETRQRCLEGVGTRKMRAVCSRARDDIGAAVEKQRSACPLHRRCQLLCNVDHAAFIGRRQAQQYRGDVDLGQRFGEAAGHAFYGLADRRGQNVKAWRRCGNWP